MALIKSCLTSGGVSSDVRIYATNESANADYYSYSNGAVTQSLIARESGTVSLSGDLSVYIEQNSPYLSHFTVVNAGYYNVEGVWTHYDANDTFTIPLESFVLWFDDLKLH